MAYPYHSISVFCGSADGLAPEYYAAAYETGQLLAQNGITLVYGAGRTGLARWRKARWRQAAR